MATLRTVPAATVNATVVQFVFGFQSVFFLLRITPHPTSTPVGTCLIARGMGANVEERGAAPRLEGRAHQGL